MKRMRMGSPNLFHVYISRAETSVLMCLNFELNYRPSVKIPVSVMMPVAHVVEWTYQKFAKYGMKVPQLTPSRIRLLSCNRTFSCSRAKDQLGYEPLVSLKVLIYIL
jgi:hypothetical protein